MKRNKFFAAFTLACSTALVGCGGEDGDNVTINLEGSAPGGGGPITSPVGDCANVVQADFISYNKACSTGTVTGSVNENFTLTADVEWQLRGAVIVGAGNVTLADDVAVQAVKDTGVVLTIEPGTNVKAYDSGSLLVTRGSLLIADGTALSPITFSSLDSNFDGSGEWGGVIIQGFAPQYGQGGTGACYGSSTVCNIKGEGGEFVGEFGGNDEADNSGILRYVRIVEGGRIAGPNNEINGLTLQGVGHGTTIEYVQVHNNLDDGIEWFGGTVSAKYLVLTGNDDDDIDFDEGYMGNIQYAIIQKDPNKMAPSGSNDPRGIEANSSDADYVSETEAVIANVTIIGSQVNKAVNSKGDGLQPGMRLRGAVKTQIFNSSVTNFDDCVRVDDADTGGDGAADVFSVVGLTNVIGDCDDKFYAKRDADTELNIIEQSISFSATFAIQESEARLASAPAIIPVANGSSFQFDQTDFIGAVDPDAGEGWWEAWIIPGSLSAAKPVETGFSTCETTESASVCTVSGVIDEDYTFVRGVEWRIRGDVIVGGGNVTLETEAEVAQAKASGVTLTIEPGVHVRAYSDASLLITRGSAIEAEGTRVSPITFSSLSDADFDGEGEWGGLIVQGFAPQYGQGGSGACYGSGMVCNIEGEGGTVVGRFGGNDPADYSGVLKYVRIAEGGRIAGPNNEINGLTLQGVGHVTTIEYVQVHNNRDDGIEWFGGTVNAKYLVLTGNDDDDIDFDEGYKGNIQYAIIRKNPNKSAPTGNNDPRGIEANSSDASYVPETEGALANILIWGSEVNKAENGKMDGLQPGMRLRGALSARIYNTAVKNFDDCVRIDDANIDGDATTGDANGIDVFSDVNLVNVLGECDDKFYAKRSADNDPAPSTGANSVTVDGAYALTDAEALVSSTDPVEVDNGSGFIFDNTAYVGAVAPGTAEADAWWNGWIIEGSLND